MVRYRTIIYRSGMVMLLEKYMFFYKIKTVENRHFWKKYVIGSYHSFLNTKARIRICAVSDIKGPDCWNDPIRPDPPPLILVSTDRNTAKNLALFSCHFVSFCSALFRFRFFSFALFCLQFYVPLDCFFNKIYRYRTYCSATKRDKRLRSLCSLLSQNILLLFLSFVSSRNKKYYV